jgi:hypothetical protein
LKDESLRENAMSSLPITKPSDLAQADAVEKRFRQLELNGCEKQPTFPQAPKSSATNISSLGIPKSMSTNRE